MLDPTGPVVTEILKGGPGVFVALFVAACSVVAGLSLLLWKSYGQRLEDQKAWAKEREDFYEARLKEMDKVITALNQNTAASSTLIATSEARTQLSSELARGQAILVEQIKIYLDQVRSYQSGSKDQTDRLERNQGDIIRLLSSRTMTQ